MDTLIRHELFQIETLDKLKSAKLLEPLVFGGETMLRLCHELNRYSVDLNFWFVRQVDQDVFLGRMRKILSENYEITDSQKKLNSLLIEIRSRNFPKKLKIEIRRELKDCDTQDSIAFSKYGTSQVILRTHTLEQSMKNKVAAALDRKLIRDFFDMEFLLRRGIKIHAGKSDVDKLKSVIEKFSDRDYKVTLGSFLDAETRNFLVKNKFNFLLSSFMYP